MRDSDGTLVLHAGRPRGGTALTLRLLGRQRKPALRLDLDAHPDPAELRRWIGAQGIRVLNVAGPRESESPGVGGRAARYLESALRPFAESDGPHRQDEP